MRNKLVLVLGMALVLLSFFAFHGGTTGFAVKERVQVTSRFVEVPFFTAQDDNDITTLSTPIPLVRRGDKFIFFIDAGSKGFYTQARVKDGHGNFVQQFYICGIYPENDKICSYPTKRYVISVSRTAYDPRKNPYTVELVDGSRRIIQLQFAVR